MFAGGASLGPGELPSEDPDLFIVIDPDHPAVTQLAAGRRLGVPVNGKMKRLLECNVPVPSLTCTTKKRKGRHSEILSSSPVKRQLLEKQQREANKRRSGTSTQEESETKRSKRMEEEMSREEVETKKKSKAKM